MKREVECCDLCKTNVLSTAECAICHAKICDNHRNQFNLSLRLFSRGNGIVEAQNSLCDKCCDKIKNVAEFIKAYPSLEDSVKEANNIIINAFKKAVMSEQISK